MKKRLWWSMLLSSAALLVTSVTAFADRPTVGTGVGVGQAPTTVNQIPVRIPSNTTSGGSTLYKAWEGVNSTNYVDRSQQIDTENLADVAVGPADILTVTNKRIVRYPNPNTIVSAGQVTALPQGGSMTTVSVGGSNYAWVNDPNAFNNALRNQQNPIYSATFMEPRQANLDNWLGDGILNILCPTLPRRNYNCLIDHATVRYDQLQGRFLVLFTVIETGIKFFGQAPSEARKASWVLAVSKYSMFTLGSNPTDLFIPPVPGTGLVLGGANTNNWYFYYGTTLGDLGSDGFGNASILGTSTPCPVNACVGAGNINSVPGLDSYVILPPTTSGGLPQTGATTPTLLATDATINNFNCSINSATGALPSDGSVCYFPTSARLGIDNDSIYITSAVVNTNYIATITVNGVTVPAPQFAGTRLRVLKKVGIYNGAFASAGNNLAPQGSIAGVIDLSGRSTTCASGGVSGTSIVQAGQCVLYDLYANTGGASPAPLTTPAGPYGPSMFTLAPGFNQAGTAFDNPAFCEPQWLRGRPVADFSNNVVPNKSYAYIECIRSVPFGTGGTLNPLTQTTNVASQIYVFPIQSVVAPPSNPQANTVYVGGVPFYPTLIGNGTLFGGGAQIAFIEGFRNAPDPYLCPNAQISNPPNPYCQTNGFFFAPLFGNPGVGQANAQNGAQMPNLFVGDDRPHKVVFREGFLYDARVVSMLGSNTDVNNSGLSTTVSYDIIEKVLGPGGAGTTANRVFYAAWQNTNSFAPMYDTPANVILSGAANPINLLPWLEKLFVATTFPALSQTDPRNSAYSPTTNPWGQNLPAGVGVPASPGGPVNFCAGPIPGVNSSIPSVTGPFSYAGLFDIHCGLDGYDTHSPFRDPVTGSLRDVVSLTVRNNGTTDPNNGSLWNYGLYAGYRDGFVNGPGQWGSYIANYDLSFPQTDPYGNGSLNYTEFPNPLPFDQTYIAVQVLRNANVIAQPCGTGQPAGCSNTVQVVSGGAAGGDVNSPITRIEMVTLVDKSISDEQGITDYLNATGGCFNSFADVSSPGCSGATVTNTTGTLTSGGVGKFTGGWRYAEYAYRRGFTKGCAGTDDVSRKFCPNDILQRYQAAAFIIRAKMNTVFPTSLNGCPALQTPVCIGGQAQDNFGLFIASPPAGPKSYFSDIDLTSEWGQYTEKMYELRITNGTSVPTFAADGSVMTQGTFNPFDNLSRRQVMAFLARAFFY